MAFVRAFAGWRRAGVLLLVGPSLVFLAGAWFGVLRTPIYHWADPDYPYLLNALSVAELAAPTHTQHPGTPVHELGAVILRVVHLLHPSGFASLREHVLARPEPFLRLWRWLALCLYAAALAGSALLIWRTTGSLAAAALFQVVPLLSVETLFSLSRVEPEPLLLALGAGATAIVVALSVDPPAWDGRPTAVVLGVLAGLGMAAKLTFAPVLIPCLAVLSRRSRWTFIAATVATAGVALVPALPTLPDNLRWYWALLVHTGYYGEGRSEVVDWSSFPGNLGRLALAEWPAVLIGMIGVVAAAWLLASGRSGAAEEGRTARALISCGLAQVAWLCVVAKHARARYLVPVVVLAGISAAVTWHAARRSARGAGARAGLIAVVLLAMAGQRTALLTRGEEIRRETALRREAGAIVASAAGAIIEATPLVSQAGGLRYGQIYAPPRFGAALRSIHPGVTAWDLLGLNSFGAPADPTRVMEPLPDGGARFRMMGVDTYPLIQSPPAGVVLTRVRSLGRHELYEGRILPCAGSGPGAYSGFFESSGLLWTPGAEPLFRGASPTRVLFTGNGAPMTLNLQLRPLARETRGLRIIVNGHRLVRSPLGAPAGFEDVRASFEPRPGVNEAIIEYGRADGHEGFEPVLEFRRLQVRCEGGG